MAVGDTSGEDKISSEVRSEKTSLEAPEALDTIPLFLTPEEREVLILFVNEVSNLSAVYVERAIQTAYLFNIAETQKILKEFNGSPYLMSFFEAYEQFIEPKSAKELVEAIKKLEKYLLPEGKIGAEAKRQKLITEVNKLVPKAYAVPSHSSFAVTLQFLKEKGYIVAAKHKSKTLWSIDPDFYAKWSARRHQLFNERARKIKEFQNANVPPEQAEMQANEYMLNKYGAEVLDFYNISYVPHRISTEVPNIIIAGKESRYLSYRAEIGLFLPK